MRFYSLILLLGMFSTNLFGVTVTPVNVGTETSLFDILDDRFGAGNYVRIDDDFDQVLEAFSVTHLESLISISSSANIFDIQSTGIDEWVVCIVTSLSYTENHCTLPSLNPDGYDYAVSFSIVGQPNLRVIAFEDWPIGSIGPNNSVTDLDYQDRVDIFQLTPREVSGVPEPATVGLLGISLLGLALLKRVRK